MPSIAYRILPALVVVALVGWGCYRTGKKVERADWLALEQQRTAAAAEAARINAAAEIRRTAAVATKRDRVQTKAREVKDAHPVDPGGCRLSDAERLRLDAVWSAYFADDTATDDGLHVGLHDPAHADEHHSGGLDRAATGLGLRMPKPAQ